MYYSNDYLCHYGVLGMKWGQHLFGKTEASRAGRKRASKKDRITAGVYRAGSATFGGVAGGIAGVIAGSTAAMHAGLSFTTVATMGTAAISTGGAAIGAAIGLGVASVTVNKAYERLKTTKAYDTMSKAITGVQATNRANYDRKYYSDRVQKHSSDSQAALAKQAIDKLSDDEYAAIYRVAYSRGYAAGT